VSPEGRLKFKHVFAPASEVTQLGKSATNRVASTAGYGAGRSENSWIEGLDRQACAIIANDLKSCFDRRVAYRLHRLKSHWSSRITIKILNLSHTWAPQLNDDVNALQTMKFAPAQNKFGLAGGRNTVLAAGSAGPGMHDPGNCMV
jgi:hypothetical protein